MKVARLAFPGPMNCFAMKKNHKIPREMKSELKNFSVNWIEGSVW